MHAALLLGTSVDENLALASWTDVGHFCGKFCSAIRYLTRWLTQSYRTPIAVKAIEGRVQGQTGSRERGRYSSHDSLWEWLAARSAPNLELLSSLTGCPVSRKRRGRNLSSRSLEERRSPERRFLFNDSSACLRTFTRPETSHRWRFWLVNPWVSFTTFALLARSCKKWSPELSA